MKILTFDIEDWFHILENDHNANLSNWNKFESRLENNLNKILFMLERKNQKATFFCLGWIAEKYPKLIQKIDEMGFEIGSHSNLHILAYEQNKSQFRKDLIDSINSIENITNKKVKYYRAPGFSLIEKNKWVFEELINQGIEIDCSIFPASRAHGGFRNFPSNKPALVSFNSQLIKEFPINTFKIFGKSIIFSGGGYFRLMPYPIIKELTNKSDYIMSYFHPRDFDQYQPIIKTLTPFRKFKSYVGLNSSLSKLERLLEQFKFIDLKEANKKIFWEKEQPINLN